MIVRKAVGALVTLGLVGGAGAVAYDSDGTATVTVTDEQGREESVQIKGDGGQSFSCPEGIEARVEPIDIEAGRVKVTLRRVRKQLKAIDRRYPGKAAPADVADRYNGLVKRENRLVDAYNDSIGEHNAVLTADCEAR